MCQEYGIQGKHSFLHSLQLLAGIFLHASHVQASGYRIYPSCSEAQGCAGSFMQLIHGKKEIQINNRTNRALHLTFSAVQQAVFKNDVHAGVQIGLQGAHTLADVHPSMKACMHSSNDFIGQQYTHIHTHTHARIYCHTDIHRGSQTAGQPSNPSRYPTYI
jgi:hypothetical protein